MLRIYPLTLLITVLTLTIWSCEDEPDPEDCLGVEGGTAYVDSCGTCDDDPSNDCVLDCSGEWGGFNICGCTDNTATNYDSTATFDDGSCIADEVPPSVAITSPTGGSQVSEVTSIQFTANDNVGIDKTEIYTSSGIIATVNGTNDVVYSTNWNTNTFNNEEVNLYAIAYDLSGNVTTSDIVTVSIYNTVTVTFENNCFLQMAFQFGKDTPEVEDYIDAEGTYELQVAKGYGTVTFQGIVASSCGETLGWDFDFDIGNSDVTKTLYVSGSYFFINLRNSSNYTVNDFYVNYGLTSEIGCALNQPNDSVQYPIGYFQAFSNSNARVYVDGESSYWYWENFGLDGSTNQYINLNFTATSLMVVGSGGEPTQENTVYETHILEGKDFRFFND